MSPWKGSSSFFYGDKQIRSGQCLVFALDQWQVLVVEVNQFPRIRLVVAPGFVFALLCESMLNFGQPFQTIPEATKTIVNTSSWDEFLLYRQGKCSVARWPSDSEKFCQMTHFVPANTMYHRGLEGFDHPPPIASTNSLHPDIDNLEFPTVPSAKDFLLQISPENYIILNLANAVTHSSKHEDMRAPFTIGHKIDHYRFVLQNS